MCLFKDDKEIAVGMTDGNLLILVLDKDVRIKVAVAFKELGGIWSICGINSGQDLAVGTINGLFFLDVTGKNISRNENEHYLKGMNVWNVREYDTYKLICTCWKESNCYIVDRNQSDVYRVQIEDEDYMNMHATDLVPLPSYDPL